MIIVYISYRPFSLKVNPVNPVDPVKRMFATEVSEGTERKTSFYGRTIKKRKLSKGVNFAARSRALSTTEMDIN